MAEQRLLPPLAALKAFEALARLGGLRKAARDLGIDHAVLARHVRTLEAVLGTRLVVRDGRSYRLTDQGRGYHAQIATALTLIDQASRGLKQAGALRLRLWCVPGLAARWLADRLDGFITAHPDIDVDLRPTDEAPDYRSDDVDGDIRYIRDWDDGGDPDFVRRLEFARPLIFPAASPAFLEGNAPLRSVGDLLSCPLLHEHPDEDWLHWFRHQGITPPARLAGPRLWHAHLTHDAAVRGQGIVLTSALLARSAIESGQLVRLALEPAPVPVRYGGYALLAGKERWGSPAMTLFRRWLSDVVGAEGFD